MSDRLPKVPWAWIGPVLAFLVGVFVLVAWRALASSMGTQDATPTPWYAVALFEVCWLTLGGLVFWGFLRQALTKFTTSGISQLTLRGWVTLQWREVTEVRRLAEGRVMELRGEGKVIRVSPLFYAHWDEVLTGCANDCQDQSAATNQTDETAAGAAAAA